MTAWKIPCFSVLCLFYHPQTVNSFTALRPTTSRTHFLPHRHPRHHIAPRSKIRLTRSTLSMHMGHSHSHGHAHTDHSHDDPTKVSKKRIIASLLSSSVVTSTLPILFPRSVPRTIPTTTTIFLVSTLTVLFSKRILSPLHSFFSIARQVRDGLLKPLRVSARRIQTPHATAPTATAREVDRVTILGVVVNLLLTILKSVAGYTCHSTALVADAGHSLSDLVSDFVTLWAVRIGRLPPDEEFPYGHGKFEAMGSLFLSLLLLGAGVGIGAESYSKLVGIVTGVCGAGCEALPTTPALVVASLSVLSKEWLYRVTKKVGEKIGSPVVIANAWHHRSDAYSSVLALGSIAVAMTVPGMLAADSAAGLLVAGMICTTGLEILLDAAKQLTDMADEDLITSITSVVQSTTTTSNSDVTSINRVRARQVGSSALVDISITVMDGLSSSATRAIEERLKWKIMQTHPKVIDVDVHATTTEICPLLIAQHEHEHDEVGGRSTSQWEEGIRKSLLKQGGVREVSDVTIHYHDDMEIEVDVNVKILKSTAANGQGSTETTDGGVKTIKQAGGLVKELKEILMAENKGVKSARLFLDLNDYNDKEEFNLNKNGKEAKEEKKEELDAKSLEQTYQEKRNETLGSLI